MNHSHRKVLHQLFEHPINANIHFNDVETVLGELGAELENRAGDSLGVALNGQKAVFHRAHHAVPKDEVMKLRHFLRNCDVNPERDYPLS